MRLEGHLNCCSNEAHKSRPLPGRSLMRNLHDHMTVAVMDGTPSLQERVMRTQLRPYHCTM